VSVYYGVVPMNLPHLSNLTPSQFKVPNTHGSQSQWLHGLRRGSVSDRLVGLCVRIPPGASVVCCQVEVSASDWSLIQRSPTECGVSECDHESSTMRRPWPTRAVVSW
jgi:hypothetical protein